EEVLHVAPALHDRHNFREIVASAPAYDHNVRESCADHGPVMTISRCRASWYPASVVAPAPTSVPLLVAMPASGRGGLERRDHHHRDEQYEQDHRYQQA